MEGKWFGTAGGGLIINFGLFIIKFHGMEGKWLINKSNMYLNILIMRFCKSDGEKRNILKTIQNFNKIKFRERLENGLFKGIGDLLHLGINFNPEVNFESAICRWKALSRIFLMNLLRT